MTAWGFGVRLIHHPWALGGGIAGTVVGIVMLQHHIAVLTDPATSAEAREEAKYTILADCMVTAAGLAALGHGLNKAIREWLEERAELLQDQQADALEIGEGHDQQDDDGTAHRLRDVVIGAADSSIALGDRLESERQAPVLATPAPVVVSSSSSSDTSDGSHSSSSSSSSGSEPDSEHLQDHQAAPAPLPVVVPGPAPVQVAAPDPVQVSDSDDESYVFRNSEEASGPPPQAPPHSTSSDSHTSTSEASSESEAAPPPHPAPPTAAPPPTAADGGQQQVPVGTAPTG